MDDLLKIIASLDVAKSAIAINKQFDSLQKKLDKLQLEAKLSKEAKKDLNIQLEKLKLQSLDLNANLSKETKKQLNTQLKEVSKNLNMDVSLNTSKTKGEAKQAADDAKKSFEGINDIKLDTLHTKFKSAAQELTNIKEKYSEVGSDPAKLSEWQRLFDASQVGQNSEELANLNSHMQLFKKELQQGRSFSDQLSDSLLNNVNAVYLFTQALRGISKMLDSIKQLDKGITDLQIATGMNRKDVEQLVNSYSELGKELGASTPEVINAANNWLRQGKTITETNKLIKDSVMLAKLGQIETAEATDYLTSASKGYGVAIQDVTGIVDKLTAVDMEAAISAGQLAQGMSYAANGADLAGLSMDRLIGILTIIGEVSQKEMSSVGRAVNTMIARINNIKIKKFIDDDTGEDLSNTEAVLGKLGIKLRDTETTYRSLDAVLDDVGTRWKSLNQVEQNSLAVAMAGVHHRESFLTLMNNYNKALAYTEIAANSSGTALEKYGAYLSGIEKSQKAFQASFEKFSSTMIDDELVKSVYEIGTALFDMGSFADGTVGKVVALSVALPVLIGLAKTLKALEISKNIGAAFSNPHLLIATVSIAAITSAISYASEATERQIQKIAELESSYNSLTSEISSLESELKTTAERIDELNAKDNLSFLEKDELSNLQASNTELETRLALLREEEELAAKKLANESTSLYNRTYGKNPVSQEKIDEYLNSDEIARAASAQNNNDISAIIADYEYYLKLKKEAESSNLAQEAEQYSDVLDRIKEQLLGELTIIQGIYDNLSQLKNPTQEQKQIINEAYDSIDAINSLLVSGEWNKFKFDKIFNSDELKSTKEKVEELAKSGDLTVEKFKEVAPVMATAFEDMGISAEEAVEHINSSVQNLDEANFNLINLQTNLTSLSSILQTLPEQMQDLEDVSKKIADGYNFSYTEIEKLKESYPELINYITRTSEGWQIQSGVIDTLSTGIRFTADEIKTLTDQHGDVIRAVDDGTGAFYLEKEALDAVGSSSLQLKHDLIAAQIEMSKQVILSSSERLSAYSTEIAAIQSLAEAQSLIANIKSNRADEALRDAQARGWVDDSYLREHIAAIENTAIESEAEILKIGENAEKLAELQKRLEELRSGGVSGGGKASGGSGSKKETDKWLEAYKAAYEELKHLQATDEITTQEYYNRLKKLDNDYFSSKEMLAKYGDKYLSERRKNTEELYKLLQTLYNEEKTELDRQLAYKLISHADYLNKLEQLNNKYFERSSEQYKKNELDIFNARKKYLEDYISAREKAYKKELDASNKYYESEIKALKEQREQKTKYYDDLIKAEQDKLSQLSKQYTEEEKLLKIEKARQDLAKALSQKTSLIFNGKEFIYDVNMDAVSQAQNTLTDLLLDYQQYHEKLAIENEIERLRRAKDNAIVIIDESISRLEEAKTQAAENINSQVEKLTELKEKWSESLDISEDITNYEELLGIILEDELGSYSSRISELTSFVEQWNKQVSKMKEPRSSGSSSMSGGLISGTTKSGGTYYLVPNDKAHGYSDGGVITHTGGAIVHGSDPKPELVLNSDGIENVGAALGITGSTKSVAQQLDKANSGELSMSELLRNFVAKSSPIDVLNFDTSQNVSTAKINSISSQLGMRSVPNLSGYERVVTNNNGSATNINIQNVNLPEVKNADDFADVVIKRYASKRLQVQYKR